MRDSFGLALQSNSERLNPMSLANSSITHGSDISCDWSRYKGQGKNRKRISSLKRKLSNLCKSLQKIFHSHCFKLICRLHLSFYIVNILQEESQKYVTLITFTIRCRLKNIFCIYCTITEGAVPRSTTISALLLVNPGLRDHSSFNKQRRTKNQ